MGKSVYALLLYFLDLFSFLDFLDFLSFLDFLASFPPVLERLIILSSRFNSNGPLHIGHLLFISFGFLGFPDHTAKQRLCI